jgi:hypothetical protein
MDLKVPAASGFQPLLADNEKRKIKCFQQITCIDGNRWNTLWVGRGNPCGGSVAWNAKASGKAAWIATGLRPSQ